MRTLKVVIVDDEYLIRIGLRMSYPWSEHCFELVGEASEGAQALRLCIEKSPDIVITDIKMPNMDGIELIRRLKDIMPTVSIIVLSGFDDYEYVRQALKLGACDYILKLSLQMDELGRILEAVRDKISMRSEKQENVITFATSSSSFEPTDDEPQVVMAIQVDDIEALRIRLQDKDEARYVQSLIHVMEQCLRDARISFELRYTGNFSWFLHILLDCQPFDILNKVYRQLADTLKTCFSITVSASVSNTFMRIEQYKAACNESVRSLEMRFFSGNESFYPYKAPISDEIADVDTHEKELMLAYASRDEDKTKRLIGDALEQISVKLCNHPQQAKYLLQQIYHTLNHIKKLENINAVEKRTDSLYIDPIMHIQSFEQGCSLLRMRDKQLHALLKQKDEDTGMSDVIKIKTYIQNNIHRSVNLKEIASFMNMSESYLSAVFSKKNGKSLTEYMTSCRMDKAKGLLRNTDQRIYEIALQCGYSDESYFGRIFRKQEGVTPFQYRYRLRNNK